MKNSYKYFLCLLIGAQAQICFTAQMDKQKRELNLFERGIFSTAEHWIVSLSFLSYHP